jgi:hypothetical protein
MHTYIIPLLCIVSCTDAKTSFKMKQYSCKILWIMYYKLVIVQTAETVDAIVTQLMEKQRLARAAALTKQLECGCPDSTCADGKTCSHPMRRITAAKTGSATELTSSSSTRQGVVNMSALNTENNNQVHTMTHCTI